MKVEENNGFRILGVSRESAGAAEEKTPVVCRWPEDKGWRINIRFFCCD